MNLYDSNRPDLNRIMDLAERRGESVTRRHDYGIAYCPTCPGSGPDEQESPRPGRGRGIQLPEREDGRPPKDPRYAWLPP